LFSELLHPDVQSFIRQHETDDVNALILKTGVVHGIPIARVADQIVGKRKSKDKLPSYYSGRGIIFPPSLNLEQCSSEKTAKFKAHILRTSVSERSRCADLTGGFGVDSLHLSNLFAEIQYVETNTDLLDIARHNHLQLGASGIKYYNTSAEQFLLDNKVPFDCIFIDPSRRSKEKRKIFSFVDCEPNVLTLLPLIFGHTSYLLVKASPFLDIKQALKELSSVKNVYVVSVDNECKELLFLCESGHTAEPAIEALNLSGADTVTTFSFRFSDEQSQVVEFSEPLTFLYEPNASILKAGAFKSVATRFNLKKLHPNTQLYTSEKLVDSFPGKIFRTLATVKPDQKALKEFFPQGQANVFTRNYPITSEGLKAKTKLNDGGDRFLIGFSGVNKKYLVAADRVR